MQPPQKTQGIQSDLFHLELRDPRYNPFLAFMAMSRRKEGERARREMTCQSICSTAWGKKEGREWRSEGKREKDRERELRRDRLAIIGHCRSISHASSRRRKAIKNEVEKGKSRDNLLGQFAILWWDKFDKYKLVLRVVKQYGSLGKIYGPGAF